MKNLFITMLLLLVFTATMLAQTARVQIIHNSPDPTVDVYVNGTNTLDDLPFRSATPFLDLPAGVPLSIDIAPSTSTSVADAIFTAVVTFDEGKTYVVTASGLVGDVNTPFTLIVDEDARETSAAGISRVDISVLHGAPDAPPVDVAIRTVGNIIDSLAYGEFTDYLSVAPGDYFLDVKPAGSATILATYRANLTAIGGQAIKVLASGLLGGPQTFGLYAVFADGTVTALPLSPVARVQLLHNSADPNAALVDVYKNGNLYANDVAFRTATPFEFIPANMVIDIGIAPANSTSANDTIKNFQYTFENGKTYVVSVLGIVGSVTTPLVLNINDIARETASIAGKVDIAVLHGATNAPAVDVDAVYVANNLISNLAYGNFTGYLSLDPAIYDLAVRASGDPNVVATFRANLSGLGGGAAYVFASGLLGGTPGFGLFAALANGTVLALPLSPTARVQVIHNAPEPTVDVYLGNTRLIDNFVFRTATPYVNVLADRPIAIGVAGENSASAADALATFPVNLPAGGTFVVYASGLLGSAPAFTLIPVGGQEAAANAGQVDIAVFHGSPNAPAVDVDAVLVANDLIDNLAYGTGTGYVALAPDVYDLAVRASGDPNVVATFRADLSGLAGGAAQVFASGLLGGTPGFGIYVALPDGTVFPLPLAPAPARVQIVHNAIAPTVDVYLDNALVADDFVFRTATPFVDVPADRSIAAGIALDNSGSAADALVSVPVSFESGKSYIVFASGIFGGTPGFELLAFEAQESGSTPGSVDIAVLHGAPNAPAVDVDAAYLIDDLINNLAYGNATGYTPLPAALYDLAVRASGDPNVVATFRADLSGLGGGAAYVFASGLLGGTPGFGLFAVLPDGTVLALPASPTARVQVIHNAPEPTVDVYIGNTRVIDNFAFRTATPFVDLLADRPIVIGVAGENSASAADALATFPVNLPAGGTFVVYASGLLGSSPAFTLIPVNGQEAAANGSQVDISVFHGSPNAPAVDVDAVLVANDLINNLAYGTGTGYVALAPDVYDLAVRASGDPNVVATFRGDLSGLAGGAAQVFASGLLGGTPGFGLYVAFPDGTVFPLPLAPAPARVQVVHNAIAPTVDVYAGNTLLIDDFAFRTATPFVDVPADRAVTLGVAPDNSNGPADALATYSLTLESGRSYVVMAGGVLSGTPGFDLFINENAQEVAVNPSNVEFSLFHGSPDAGSVDVRLLGGPVLFDNISFGEYADYLSVPANEYAIGVTPANDNSNILAAYLADLTGLTGGAATVFASGYVSGADPAFGVWVALADGTTFPLPQFVKTNELESKLEALQLSPNPTNADLLVQFKLTTSQNLRYAVRDVTGRMVMEGDFGLVQTGLFNASLNVGHLSTGLYQLEIRSETGVKTNKFVVSE